MRNFVKGCIDRWSIGALFAAIYAIWAAFSGNVPGQGFTRFLNWLIGSFIFAGVVFLAIYVFSRFFPQKKPSSFSLIKLSIQTSILSCKVNKFQKELDEIGKELEEKGCIIDDNNSSFETSNQPAPINQNIGDDDTASFLKQEAIKIVNALTELNADVKLLDIELDSGFAIFYVVPCTGIQMNTIIDLKSKLMLRISEVTDVFSDYSKSAVGIKVLASVTTSQISLIDQMDGPAFEQFIVALLRKSGYENVQSTGGSGDQGVDVLAEKEGVRYAIQCKRYSHALGNTPVQEVNAGCQHYGCHVGVVVTNNYFTAGAKELAASCKVLLWDREKLIEMLKLNNWETVYR